MSLVAEARSFPLVTAELACNAMRRAFIAAIGLDANSFPVVIRHASDP